MGQVHRAELLVAAAMPVMIGLVVEFGDTGEGVTDATVLGVPPEVAEPSASPSHTAVPASPRPLAAVTVRYDLDRGLAAPIWDAGRRLPLHSRRYAVGTCVRPGTVEGWPPLIRARAPTRLRSSAPA